MKLVRIKTAHVSTAKEKEEMRKKNLSSILPSCALSWSIRVVHYVITAKHILSDTVIEHWTTKLWSAQSSRQKILMCVSVMPKHNNRNRNRHWLLWQNGLKRELALDGLCSGFASRPQQRKIQIEDNMELLRTKLKFKWNDLRACIYSEMKRRAPARDVTTQRMVHGPGGAAAKHLRKHQPRLLQVSAARSSSTKISIENDNFHDRFANSRTNP